jgi:F0F1-type ATP synthase delta subunit
MSSKELSEEALASILEHVNYNPKDKLVRIVSPDLGVGATVSYKDTFVDATLFTMLSKALNK